MTDIVPQKADQVFQHNAIGRAVHTLPMYLRRLIAVGMARIKWDDGMEVRFSVSDALDALGMKKETANKRALMIASVDALGQTVQIDDREKSGTWIGYTWFSYIKIDDTDDTITMKFNPDLRPYLLDFSERFSLFTLSDYGKLTGEYTQKVFDLAISFRGHAGKDGNKKDCWFFEYSLPEIRMLLNVSPSKYPRTGDFRTRVVDGSVKQINEADIGLWIECEYKYKGKTLNAIRFNCKSVSRSDPRPVTPATETEKEYAKLIEKYPTEYQRYYNDAKKQAKLDGTFPTHEEADAVAVKELLAVHKK